MAGRLNVNWSGYNRTGCSILIRIDILIVTMIGRFSKDMGICIEKIGVEAIEE
ncbi:hypothetical protein ACFOGI_00715 [Virgibacillus xinjiangensis]|uniref:Uncharacterized protein n=1 Tax=Virgibacillus xinjiangensis TaxID=393090 RepID=A0ABV7CR50_9BACI